MLTVVTFLWREENGRHNHLFLYSADYVNRLRSMLERHLKQPHELVCVTDMPEGIDPRVRIVPQPYTSRLMGENVPGWFRRLSIFHPDADTWLGRRILLMDIDCVILDDLDPLLEGAGDFKAWEPRLYWAKHRHYSRYNMSFVLMDAGARPEVWERFTPEGAESALSKSGLAVDDQTWVSYVLGPNEDTWPWDGEIRSLKATPEPEAARIVFFNGPRSPAMPEIQRQHPWIRNAWQ